MQLYFMLISQYAPQQVCEAEYQEQATYRNQSNELMLERVTGVLFLDLLNVVHKKERSGG